MLRMRLITLLLLAVGQIANEGWGAAAAEGGMSAFARNEKTVTKTTGAVWLAMRTNLNTVKITANDNSPATATAVKELATYWRGRQIALVRDKSLADDDGFVIASGAKGKPMTVRAHSGRGLLFAAYHLLRMQALGQAKAMQDAAFKPATRLRIVSYYLAGFNSATGYGATTDLFCPDEINGVKGTMSLRMKEALTRHCRACASVGVNGMVMRSGIGTSGLLSAANINKVKVFAEVCRSFGIRLYLSVDPASPETTMSITAIKSGGISPEKWWRDRVRQLFSEIPDFGGFLVEPRSAVPGNGMMTTAMTNLKAEFIAKAVAPYGATVIVARDVTPPQSLVFGAQDGSYGYRLTGLPSSDNMKTLLRNGSTATSAYAAFAPYLLYSASRGMMVELRCDGKSLRDNSFVDKQSAGWQQLLSAPLQSRIEGTVLRYSASADGYGLGRELEQRSLYAFGRLTWDCRITVRQINNEWSRLSGSLSGMEKGKL